MSKYPELSLDNVLAHTREHTPVSDSEHYQITGIYSFGKGLIKRSVIQGSETAYKSLTQLRTGQFVMSKLNAWEGALSVVSSTFDGTYVSPEYPVFEIDEKSADIGYVRHLASWPKLWERLTPRGSMVRRKRTTPETLLATTVPLPDLDEQRRIAEKLDLILAKNDSIIDSTGSSDITQAKLLAISGLDQLLARSAVDFVSVGTTCDMISDTVHPGEDPAPAKEFVGLEHIESHLGRRVGSRLLGNEKGRKFRFQPGDILYGYLRPYLNKVWIADRHGLCSVEQYVLRPNGLLNSQIIASALRSKRSLDRVADLTHNLQLPRLRSGFLLSLEIPFIRAEEQGRVAAKLATHMERCEHYVDLLTHRDELLACLQPSILNAAFTGQL